MAAALVAGDIARLVPAVGVKVRTDESTTTVKTTGAVGVAATGLSSTFYVPTGRGASSYGLVNVPHTVTFTGVRASCGRKGARRAL